jgi:hypothetical protein
LLKEIGGGGIGDGGAAGAVEDDDAVGGGVQDGTQLARALLHALVELQVEGAKVFKSMLQVAGRKPGD